uniref:Novel plant SNARE 11 n=1 Tax=Tanacetum cinerariifolium TaxID=118510 RepID=A0A6L2L0L3_TANCI|nr:novel plant SNARE 11 [Tanacetum cinerariifolium]
MGLILVLLIRRLLIRRLHHQRYGVVADLSLLSPISRYVTSTTSKKAKHNRSASLHYRYGVVTDVVVHGGAEKLINSSRCITVLGKPGVFVLAYISGYNDPEDEVLLEIQKHCIDANEERVKDYRCFVWFTSFNGTTWFVIPVAQASMQLMDNGHQMMDETDQAIEHSKKVVHETVNVRTETATALKAQGKGHVGSVSEVGKALRTAEVQGKYLGDDVQ